MIATEKRKEIKEYYAGIPKREVSPGIYLKTIGYKYLTLLSTWGNTHYIKTCLHCFETGDYGHCNH